MQLDIGFSVEHDPNGQPYLACYVQSPGVNISFVFTDKQHGVAMRDGIIKSINELLKAKPKLVPVEGSLSNGIRAAEGRQ